MGELTRKVLRLFKLVSGSGGSKEKSDFYKSELFTLFIRLKISFSLNVPLYGFHFPECRNPHL